MLKRTFTLVISAISLPVCAEQPVYLDSIINAEVVDRVVPKYPTQLGRKGQEGWVQLSYVVSAQGTVENVLVEDSSGQRLFEKAAKEAVEKWTFEPAQLDGKPVQQCKNGVLFDFSMSKPSKGVTRRFANRVESIQSLIKAGELDAAKVQLDLLEDKESWNLNEGAVLWMVKAAYQQAKGAAEQELQSLKRALAYEDRLTDEQLFVLRARRFQLEVSANLLAAALETFNKLRTNSNHQDVIAQLQPYADNAAALLASESPIAVEGAVDERALWSHGLSRNRFTLIDVEGELVGLEVRCDSQHSSYKAIAELIWDVPQSWGQCSVYVKGEPNSRFTLVELAPETKSQKS
ncbi:energy transducer TonB [Aliiglaciecola sp. CAU 1673]|uniref:energy transducer TonB n=1 Tax=Aliiglaciecola sp. CAU 1673 TaxID=3032595 RepID=UPI0023D9C5EB|nr:energy transducer TonB [Aliiglaciecola sp. CAU 1673]MDF2177450.1 energy transducer TonB [Aliiglaciecola sp. CAU 1673]